MGRTAVACALLVGLAYAATNWLTHDFEVWTAEGSRRLEVAMRPVAAPPVTLAGPGVRAQSLAALLAANGTPTIVDFMYTRCVTVCAALGGAFQQMQGRIVQRRNATGSAPVRLLSISFDPLHDDAGALSSYAARLQADPAVWVFARAADPADTLVMLERFQVTVIADGLGGYEHNAALLVMDAGGRLVRVFDYADRETALAFAESLPRAGGVR
ncbi:MAG: SCO family protein [Burkholderiales bacterium]|nr:SCO family protein [Burkholderiales bacterium]